VSVTPACPSTPFGRVKPEIIIIKKTKAWDMETIHSLEMSVHIHQTICYIPEDESK
jgi:hypothetical protein